MKTYNTTQLHPETSFVKHVFHRDQFAHYLRWTHVLNKAKIGMNVLDFGCGSGNLAEVLYRNRYKCNLYLGLDIREQTIKKASEKFNKVPWVRFHKADLVNIDIKNSLYYNTNWDIITSFEVIEHLGKQNAEKYLQNIASAMNKDTILLLSTPNYDERVGAAENHIINNEICEFKHDELKKILEKYFTIEEKYGTFASQKDYKHLLTPEQLKIFNQLNKYYDSNLMSVLFAPLFPVESRNCIWILKLKKQEVKNETTY